MRQIPQELQEAIQTGARLKKRILLQRRRWNAAQNKYELESEAVDISHLLVEAGSIKMALDTDEADKWDASNVTLTFANELNCFKEGLSGSLFEQAVLWGSKMVYALEPEGKPDARTAVFTGYIYTSPVWRENGRLLELTISSSLDALDYVSAEDFCLGVTDELATAVESENEQEQGKAFATQQTGVGYIDCVKYGADFASAEELLPEAEYEVSDLDLVGLPAVIKLKFVPTDGHKMWVSYRYWHKDMKIEDIVNALLDLAGVEERNVENAAFEAANQGVRYENINQGNLFLFGPDLETNTWHRQEFAYSNINGPEPATIQVWLRSGAGYDKTCPFKVPKYGYFNIGYPNASFYIFAADFHDDFAELFFKDTIGNGLKIRYTTDGNYHCEVLHINSGNTTRLYYADNRAIVGFELNGEKIFIYTDGLNKKYGNGTGDFLERTEVACPMDGEFSSLQFKMGGASWSDQNNIFIAKLGWRKRLLSPTQYIGKNRNNFYPSVFNEGDIQQFIRPGGHWEFELGEEASKWKTISFRKTVIGTGTGQWAKRTSQDRLTWTSLETIQNGDNLRSSAPYLEIYYTCTSLRDYEQFENIEITSAVSSPFVPLVNCKDLTVKDAIEQLAKLVAYEIGFDQDGVFFFRHRQGRRCKVDITDAQLIELDNHRGGIEDLTNRVSVEYGLFKTTVDDFTENKARPHSIDTYGVQEKTISAGNFVPADNVDISRAVALLNYEAFCTPQAVLTADCMPDLRLELGDIITVRAGNEDLANPQSGDYNQFVKLPAWGRSFKVRGIELDTDKRKMTLELKDVSTEDTIPAMDYVNYQTQFPTPLNYKE